MASWLDHLTAIIVAGVVILILAAVWYRGQVSALATTNTYRDRARVEVLRETVEHMARLGSGVDTADPAILAYSWTGTTRTFEFRGQLDSPTVVDRVRYLATRQACTAGSGTCWRFRRQTLRSSTYRTSGFDLEVTSVEIALLPAGAPASATTADVRVVLPAPELRPNTTGNDPRRLPVSFDRHYRLVNQVLRAAS